MKRAPKGLGVRDWVSRAERSLSGHRLLGALERSVSALGA